MKWLGVDPGTQGNAAWAIVDDATQVLGISRPAVIAAGLGAYWEAGRSDVFVQCAVEVPRIYPGGKTKNPNDLITLALYSGAVEFYLSLVRGFQVKRVFPQDWKGQLPKEVTIARIQKRFPEAKRTVDALDLPATSAHNVYDAIGIALHIAGHSLKGQ